MVVTEANAVGTAWLRAGFLDEPDSVVTRELLKEYVAVRLSIVEDPAQFNDAMIRSGEIHNELWTIVEETVDQGNDSDAIALYIESINEVIDVHLLRLTAATRTLPAALIVMLYATMVLSFLMVGVASSSDGKRDMLAIALFADIASYGLGAGRRRISYYEGY